MSTDTLIRLAKTGTIIYRDAGDYCTVTVWRLEDGTGVQVDRFEMPNSVRAFSLSRYAIAGILAEVEVAELYQY